jgi:hypothetical protein
VALREGNNSTRHVESSRVAYTRPLFVSGALNRQPTAMTIYGLPHKVKLKAKEYIISDESPPNPPNLNIQLQFNRPNGSNITPFPGHRLTPHHPHILMASTMPSFISRLFRPFSTSASLGLTAGGGTISTPEGAAKATVAAGCFWGVEHLYRKEFTGKGLYDARVGYIGGDVKNPSYRSVCSGRTGRMISLPLSVMDSGHRRHC